MGKGGFFFALSNHQRHINSLSSFLIPQKPPLHAHEGPRSYLLSKWGVPLLYPPAPGCSKTSLYEISYHGNHVTYRKSSLDQSKPSEIFEKEKKKPNVINSSQQSTNAFCTTKQPPSLATSISPSPKRFHHPCRPKKKEKKFEKERQRGKARERHWACLLLAPPSSK